MDIIRETITVPNRNALFPPSYWQSQGKAILDIETLGLSPKHAPCVLCGVLLENPTDPTQGEVIQLLAEDPSATQERHMLEALESVLEGVSTLITYNGQSFDLPFLAERRRQLALPPMAPRYHLDVLRFVRSFSPIPAFLPNLKQKTLEDFCGITSHRRDGISGKESIALYQAWQKTKNLPDFSPTASKSRGPEDFSTMAETLSTEAAQTSLSPREQVLLHNRDDLVQLFQLTKVLRQVDMEKGLWHYGFPVKTGDFLFLIQRIHLGKTHLTATGQVPHCPDYVHYGENDLSLRILHEDFSLSIPLIHYQGLSLVDVEGLGIPLEASVLQEGFLVLQRENQIFYHHGNLLLKSILERISTICNFTIWR